MGTQPMKRTSARPLLCALLGGAVAAVAVVAFAPGERTLTRTVAASAGESLTALAADQRGHESLAHLIYERAAPSVVAILATTVTSGPFGGSQSDSGSGIIVGAGGLILTNNHVVAGASKIVVQFGGSGGPTRSAAVVGVDPSTDIALLSVHPEACGSNPCISARRARCTWAIPPTRSATLHLRPDSHRRRDLGTRSHDHLTERREHHGRDPDRRRAQPGQLRWTPA